MSEQGVPTLGGKKGLIVGIANGQSIAWGCAKAFRALGAADLAVTYQNEKALPHVAPLAAELGAGIVLPLDARDGGQMDTLFSEIGQRWGRLDFVLHSIAFAPKADLQGRLVDSSRDGFLEAMDVTCHSFLRLARCAEPLMTGGGTLFTMSYLGADRVVGNYGLMGPVKAGLEPGVRYLAAELGGKDIRVHAISPGPLPTRAASGLKDFEGLMARAAARAPAGRLVTVGDIGMGCAWLATDAGRMITGGTLYIDGGLNFLAPA